MAKRAQEAALDALGNPVRRDIIQLLSRKERSVSDLAEALPVSRPAVSRHLRLLGEAGLVSHDDRGTKNIYRLEKAGFAEARAYLDGFWDEALSRFKMVAENSRRRRRRS